MTTGGSKGAVLLPQKRELFGIGVTVALIEDVAEAVTASAVAGSWITVEAIATYNLLLGHENSDFRHVMNGFDLVIVDGQPIRFAMNWLHNAQMKARVTARDLIPELLRRAEVRGLPIFLYGDEPQTIRSLVERFSRDFPKLRIAGAEPSVFRALTHEETEALAHRINSSGAALLFVALGCPLQEWFVHQNRGKINAVQLCVGSAFKYHAGERIIAPQWMQNAGLEWLFRVALEPRRLWRRFFLINQRFVWMLLYELFRKHVRSISDKRST